MRIAPVSATSRRDRFLRSPSCLPLRGADPSLEACLEGLLAQDYPAYRVHIVIDSAEDPAQAVVARILAEAGPRAAAVHVETRRILGDRLAAPR